jgi:hypothetical protein
MGYRLDTPDKRAASRASYTARITAPAFTESLPDGSLVLAYEEGGKAFSIAFAGTAGKPAHHYRYRELPGGAGRPAPLARAIEACQQFLAGRRSHAERVGQRRTERTAYQTTLEPGTVLMSMWGYDQTNIDYYQVVEVSASRKTVKIRPIAQRSVDGEQYMTGSCWPLADHFTGPAMVKRIGQGDSVRLTSYSSASPWTPKADHWTAYA